MTADEALRETGSDCKAPATAEAKERLRELLKDGPVPAADVWAKADGLCERTVKATKKALGVRSTSQGGSGAGWAWELPNR